MATRKIELGQAWVQITTDDTWTTIECLSGTGVIVAAVSMPDGDQVWGHVLRAGDPITTTEPTFARASQISGGCVLVVT